VILHKIEVVIEGGWFMKRHFSIKRISFLGIICLVLMVTLLMNVSCKRIAARTNVNQQSTQTTLSTQSNQVTQSLNSTQSTQLTQSTQSPQSPQSILQTQPAQSSSITTTTIPASKTTTASISQSQLFQEMQKTLADLPGLMDGLEDPNESDLILP
jgi:hypothetical protein